MARLITIIELLARMELAVLTIHIILVSNLSTAWIKTLMTPNRIHSSPSFTNYKLNSAFNSIMLLTIKKLNPPIDKSHLVTRLSPKSTKIKKWHFLIYKKDSFLLRKDYSSDLFIVIVYFPASSSWIDILMKG